MALLQCPLEDWILVAQKAKNETPPPPRNSKTKIPSSEPWWPLKYLITLNFCARFQLNRLTTTFGLWNTFSKSDTQDFTLTKSTGTVELRFLQRGCLQSDNITSDHYHSGPLRDQFFPLTMPTTLLIETHQPWATFVIHQSLTAPLVQIVRLSKSTLSPDEDLQCAVASRPISKWQSWDKR